MFWNAERVAVIFNMVSFLFLILRVSVCFFVRKSKSKLACCIFFSNASFSNIFASNSDLRSCKDLFASKKQFFHGLQSKFPLTQVLTMLIKLHVYSPVEF